MVSWRKGGAMKKLVLSKESLRKLDDAALEHIVGGRNKTTIGWCKLLTSCWLTC